jgi:hypothetical protein
MFAKVAGQSAAASSLLAKPEVALAYDLTSNSRIGIEGGVSSYAVQGQSVTVDSTPTELNPANGYSRVTYGTAITQNANQWVRALFIYTFNPTDAYPIEAGLSTGLAFQGKVAPSAALTIGVSRVLYSGVLLDLHLVANGSWSNSTSGSTVNTSGSGTYGIIHQEAPTTVLFTPAVGIRAGIRFHP